MDGMKKVVVLDMGICGTQHIFKDGRGKSRRKYPTSVTEIFVPDEKNDDKEETPEGKAELKKTQ